MNRLWVAAMATAFVLVSAFPALAIQGESPAGKGNGVMLQDQQRLQLQDQTCLSGDAAQAQTRTMLQTEQRATQGKGAGCRLVVNNRECVFGDVQPLVKSGRVLVPVRAVTEALGATVQWNQQTRTATISTGDKMLTLRLEERIALVNGKEITLDVPAKSERGRVVVPLRFIAQALGYNVGYDIATGTVTVESPQPTEVN
ncbi:MAG: copper amine oxidase N-terminal domain-containing protein [Thermoanaerobacterales bacterium]|nr:copper amine oxidase N-terminal domain-containing protein [Thermoanaerobacterales bacterium]